MWLPIIIIAPSLLLLVLGVVARGKEGNRPGRLCLMMQAAALLSFIAALVACLFVYFEGARTFSLIPGVPWPLLRVDVISLTMLSLVSFIGVIVLRFASRYLLGEDRHGPFMGWLAITLCTVLILVQAGDLITLTAAWIASSLCLHKLLVFYPQRVKALQAARKKFFFIRICDAALVLAGIAMVVQFQTIDISVILEQARAGVSGLWATVLMTVAASLLALAAVLKSAQFPSHGWLTEVMEAPTPVSALLHAGVINAGGFLLIRFADVLLLSPGVLAGLVMVGGFTAIFGGLVMLAQPAVKTSLAWSTIAQMGFMIMQCGLALFPLALLHIVAHSLYKAHAFMLSGSAVEFIVANRRPGPVAVPGLGAVTWAFAIALVIYAVIALSFGLGHKSPQSIALGAILIFGVAYLVAQGLAETAPRALTIRTSLAAVFVSISYFTLQLLAEWITAGVLPLAPYPTSLEWALLTLAVVSFGGVAVAQSTFPLWATHPAAASFRVHLTNGLYVNAVMDRILGSPTAKEMKNSTTQSASQGS